MTTSVRTRLVRRADGDPAPAQFVAAGVTAMLGGATEPVVLSGLERRASGGLPILVQFGVGLAWCLLVVALVSRRSPWRRLVEAGLARDDAALATARATAGERRSHHLRWLGATTAWAVLVAVLATAVVVAVLGALVPSSWPAELLRGCLAALTCAVAAGFVTGRMCLTSSESTRTGR